MPKEIVDGPLRITAGVATRILLDVLPGHMHEQILTSRVKPREHSVSYRGKQVVVFSGWEFFTPGATQPWIKVTHGAAIYVVDPTKNPSDGRSYLYASANGHRAARIEEFFKRLYPAWKPSSTQNNH